MYYKTNKSWTKHLDFILLDLCCLQIAYYIAYVIRHGVDSNPYGTMVYRNVVLVLALVQFVVAVFGNNFKNVLKRGYYKELVAVLMQVLLVTFISMGYLFFMKVGSAYSRITMLFMGIFYFIFSYVVRLLWKIVIKKRHEVRTKSKSMLILTTSDKAEKVLEHINANKYHGYQLVGMVLLDEERKGESLYGLDVVANASDVVQYVCRSWVDELFIAVERNEFLPQEMIDDFNEMGVTMHLKLQGLDNPFHRVQTVQKVAGYSVLSYSVAYMPENAMAIKRLMDICGGIIGCILTGVLTIFVGPVIYIASPGPIFFSQTRIGQNGKPFKIYKFRSMYMDAEARKAELMAQNEVSDGMMFKMEDDPRIIKGIGHFIRKTSIDEFPQFLNVLKGDMSLVGTRPPTMDEWVKYDLHHRLRMAIRPGITGIWQVSGRSDIKEFEEVVKLDAEYIANWDVGLDIKIILKTVKVMFTGNGAK